MDDFVAGVFSQGVTEGLRTIETGIPSTGGSDCGTETLNNSEQNQPGSSFSAGCSFSSKERLLEKSEARSSSVINIKSVNMNGIGHNAGSLPTGSVNLEIDHGDDLAGDQWLPGGDWRVRPKTATELDGGICQFCAEGSCHKHLDLGMHSGHRSETAHSLPERNMTPLSPVLDFTASEREERDVDDDGEPLVEAPPSVVESRFWFCNISRQDKLILLCLVLVDLTSQMCLSIMAPFFPAEVSVFYSQ